MRHRKKDCHHSNHLRHESAVQVGRCAEQNVDVSVFQSVEQILVEQVVDVPVLEC